MEKILIQCQLITLKTLIITSPDMSYVGPCHHGMAHPQAVQTDTVSVDNT